MSTKAEKVEKAETKQKSHRYLECGLNNVWISGGFDEIPGPNGERTISIRDLEGLHRCIANCLIKKPAPLTGAEFRFLRNELDLSQSTMGRLCGREERIVREWETRGEAVGEPANTIIRFVYEQRYNPSAQFEEVSKTIGQLQALDKELHELKFKIKSTESGWEPENCRERRAA